MRFPPSSTSRAVARAPCPGSEMHRCRTGRRRRGFRGAGPAKSPGVQFRACRDNPSTKESRSSPSRSCAGARARRRARRQTRAARDRVPVRPCAPPLRVSVLPRLGRAMPHPSTRLRAGSARRHDDAADENVVAQCRVDRTVGVNHQVSADGAAAGGAADLLEHGARGRRGTRRSDQDDCQEGREDQVPTVSGGALGEPRGFASRALALC